jgi:hypothetical protein
MKVVLIGIGLLCSFFHVSQDDNSKESMLTAHSWEIKTHTMTGVGIHKSIPKGTTLEFLKDKTWKSSEPIEDFKAGKWSFENEGHTLSMNFGGTERKLQIQELTPNDLRYRISRFGAVYSFGWGSKQ